MNPQREAARRFINLPIEYRTSSIDCRRMCQLLSNTPPPLSLRLVLLKLKIIRNMQSRWLINARPHLKKKKQQAEESKAEESAGRRRSSSRRRSPSWIFHYVIRSTLFQIPEAADRQSPLSPYVSLDIPCCFFSSFSFLVLFSTILSTFFSDSFSLFVFVGLLAHNPFSLCALFVHASRQHLIDRIHFDWSDRRCW